MAAIRFRSPVNAPLHPASAPVPPVGEFRVTQRFGDPDFYWLNIDPAKAALGHRATDIGDRQCGSTLVAMAAGRVTHHVDNATAYGAPNNAICSRLDVGPGTGIVIDYWHCAGHLVGNGALVQPGTPVAILGNTGLGQTCHCHITARVNGQLIDPEPLMFGGTLGEDMQIPPGTQVIAQGSVPPQAALRSSPVVADDNIIRRTETETQLAILWLMPGQGYYVKDGKQYRDWLAVALGEGIAYVAKEFVSNIFVTAAGQTIIPTQVASGITQAQLEAARLEGFTVGKSKAKVAVEGIKP